MLSLQDDVLTQYEYNAVDRLTRRQRGSDRFEEYTYDAVGNRDQYTDERGIRPIPTTGGTTTTDLAWEPNGNLLTEQVQGGSLSTYT